MKLTGKFRIKEIKKKTAATFFKELKIGDEFELVYDFNGFYKGAPTIDIYKDGKFIICNKATQLTSNLDKFELEQQ